MMAEARVRKMNLPDAPKPTRSVKYQDPRDKEREQRLREAQGKSYEMRKRNEGKPIRFWDEARVAKLRRLWNEGESSNYIAREVGADIKTVQNRLTVEIRAGRLESRKRPMTDEEVEKIYRLFDAGMTRKQIAKDLRRAPLTIQKILEERARK
jgi:DNA-binding NarL/FixJ family response regulator